MSQGNLGFIWQRDIPQSLYRELQRIIIRHSDPLCVEEVNCHFLKTPWEKRAMKQLACTVYKVQVPEPVYQKSVNNWYSLKIPSLLIQPYVLILVANSTAALDNKGNQFPLIIWIAASFVLCICSRSQCLLLGNLPFFVVCRLFS